MISNIQRHDHQVMSYEIKKKIFFFFTPFDNHSGHFFGFRFSDPTEFSLN